MTAPTRRPVGRPSKIVPEVISRLETALQQGMTLAAAATYAGINERTLHRWLARAEDPDSGTEYQQIRQLVSRARANLQAEVLVSVLETIRGGALVRRSVRTLPNGDTLTEEQYAPPDGKLGLELLSRLFKTGEFARTPVEVTGAGGGPIEVATAEKMQAIAARFAAAIGAASDIEDAEIVDEPVGRAA